MTPVQMRAKIVSVLKAAGFDSRPYLTREFGRNKAWIRRQRRVYMAEAEQLRVKIAKALGLKAKAVRVARGYPRTEISISGPGFSVALNNDGGRTTFIQTVTTKAVGDWRAHDGHPTNTAYGYGYDY